MPKDSTLSSQHLADLSVVHVQTDAPGLNLHQITRKQHATFKRVIQECQKAAELPLPPRRESPTTSGTRRRSLRRPVRDHRKEMVDLFFDTEGFYSTEEDTDEMIMHRELHPANSLKNSVALGGPKCMPMHIGLPGAQSAYVAKLVVRRPYGSFPIVQAGKSSSNEPVYKIGSQQRVEVDGGSGSAGSSRKLGAAPAAKVKLYIDGNESKGEAALVEREYTRSLNQLAVPSTIAHQFGIPPEEAGAAMSAWDTMMSIIRFAARSRDRRLLYPALLRAPALMPGIYRISSLLREGTFETVPTDMTAVQVSSNAGSRPPRGPQQFLSMTVRTSTNPPGG